MAATVEKSAALSLTPAEKELELLAQSHTKAHSVSVTAAYDAILKSDEGRAAYHRYDAERRAREGRAAAGSRRK